MLAGGPLNPGPQTPPAEAWVVFYVLLFVALWAMAAVIWAMAMGI